MKPSLRAALPTAVLFLSFASAVFAASDRLKPEDYASLLRIDLRATKAGIVAESLELTPQELERFWPVYREYDEELSKLNVERINLLRDFSESYTSIDNRKAAELTRRSFEIAHRRLALLEKYADKIAHATSQITAARFVQVENQMLMLVDVEIGSVLPLIPRESIASRMPPK